MRHLAFLVERFDPGADGAFEVAGDLERLVSEVVALEVAPGSLDVVQLRGVGWQPLDGDPSRKRFAFRRGRTTSASVDALLVWTDPLSSTSTTGRRVQPGLGPYRQSSSSSRPMKSALVLVGEVWTSNSRVATSSVPIVEPRGSPDMAILRDWPGA